MQRYNVRFLEKFDYTVNVNDESMNDEQIREHAVEKALFMHNGGNNEHIDHVDMWKVKEQEGQDRQDDGELLRRAMEQQQATVGGWYMQGYASADGEDEVDDDSADTTTASSGGYSIYPSFGE